MLVLSRKHNEKLIIVLPDGTEIAILVADLRRDTVRLGVEAPREIAVHREEVWKKIKEERNNGSV